VADLKKTMDAVSELHKSHGVTQKGGKKYTQVVHRMEAFRREHGTDFGIDTEILVNDGKRVVVKAIITDKDNRRVGAGMAEEIRGQGLVNTTSALENAETSAIGRALASLGLAGGEYASANEMDAVVRKTENLKQTPPKEVRSEVVANSYSSNQEKSSPPPTETWEEIQEKVNKKIAGIKGKMYSVEIRKEARLNDLRKEFYAFQDQYRDHEKFADIKKMFIDAQTELSK
jgi:hypothetical protein